MVVVSGSWIVGCGSHWVVAVAGGHAVVNAVGEAGWSLEVAGRIRTLDVDDWRESLMALRPWSCRGRGVVAAGGSVGTGRQALGLLSRRRVVACGVIGASELASERADESAAWCVLAMCGGQDVTGNHWLRGSEERGVVTRRPRALSFSRRRVRGRRRLFALVVVDLVVGGCGGEISVGHSLRVADWLARDERLI